MSEAFVRILNVETPGKVGKETPVDSSQFAAEFKVRVVRAQRPARGSAGADHRYVAAVRAADRHARRRHHQRRRIRTVRRDVPESDAE